MGRLAETENRETEALSSISRKIKLYNKALQESQVKTLPPMTDIEAKATFDKLQIMAMVGEELNIPCDAIIQELQKILEKYPELWVSVEQPVEDLLTLAS